MYHIDLAALDRTPLTRDPFDHLIAPHFVRPDSIPALIADFPDTGHAGLAPLSALDYGGAFAELIDDIQSDEVEHTFSRKFGIDLSRLPLMITVRSRARARDGKIHTDTESKVVTALLYLNEPWSDAGGRLRFLRGPDDLDDMLAEVPPDAGTLAAFRRSDRSYHGHKPYEGPRRAIMFNWMTDHQARRQELSRHRFSARLKRLLGA